MTEDRSRKSVDVTHMCDRTAVNGIRTEQTLIDGTKFLSRHIRALHLAPDLEYRKLSIRAICCRVILGSPRSKMPLLREMHVWFLYSSVANYGGRRDCCANRIMKYEFAFQSLTTTMVKAALILIGLVTHESWPWEEMRGWVEASVKRRLAMLPPHGPLRLQLPTRPSSLPSPISDLSPLR